MNDEIKVIWKKGDGDMPEKAKCVVDSARGEILLKALGLSEDIINRIRYNADKDSKSVNDYISRIVLERL